MFNNSNGIKIARYDNNKYIYLNDPKKISLSDEFYKKYKKLPLKTLKILKKSILNNIEPEDNSIKIIYNDAEEDKKQHSFNKTTTKDKLEVLPRTDCREVGYVSGVSGSGKSTYVASYIKNYIKMFPDNPIYIFSSLEKDKAFDKYKVKRIKIDESLIENPLSFEQFEDSLVIFDDTNTIKDKKLLAIVDHYKAHIIECGRHIRARILITSHIISDHMKTRQVLNECSFITVFPNNNKYHIIKYLKNYAGMSKEQIERILNIKSRWITIYNHYPSYLIYETGIMNVNDI
jgi:hypothetical protein